MGLPPRTRTDGPGHPLGRGAFRVGLVGCLVCMVLAAVVAALADGDLQGAAVALLVLGAVALGTLVILKGLEALVGRRRGPADAGEPPTASNGHGVPPRFRSPRDR